MKHAFPGGARGDVWISLNRSKAQTYVLSVRDNGVGLPDDLDWRQSKSLGLNLVTDLTKQIEGTIDVNSSPGTQFIITFKELQYKERG